MDTHGVANGSGEAMVDNPSAPWWYSPNQMAPWSQLQEHHTQAISRLEAGLCRLQERLSDAFLAVEERINDLEANFKNQCDKQERAHRHTSTSCKGLKGALEAVASRVNEITSGLEALADCTTDVEGKIQQDSTSKSSIDSGFTSADLARRLKNCLRPQEAHHTTDHTVIMELQQFFKEVLQKELDNSRRHGFPQVPQPLPQPQRQPQPQWQDEMDKPPMTPDAPEQTNMASAQRRSLSASICQHKSLDDEKHPHETPKRSKSVIVPPVARVPVMCSSKPVGQPVGWPMALPVIVTETCVSGGNDASPNVVSAHAAGIALRKCRRSANVPCASSASVKRCSFGMSVQRVLQARPGNQLPADPTRNSRPGHVSPVDPTTNSRHGSPLSPVSPISTNTRLTNLSSPTSRTHTGHPSPVLPKNPRQLQTSSPNNTWRSIIVHPCSPPARALHTRNSIGVLTTASSVSSPKNTR